MLKQQYLSGILTDNGLNSGIVPQKLSAISYSNSVAYFYSYLLLFLLVGLFFFASRSLMESVSIAGVTYAAEMRSFFKKDLRFLSKPLNSSFRSSELNLAFLSVLSKDSSGLFIFSSPDYCL